ncbi:MAG: hypothetical protein IPN15_16650 [Saprospiraceae bacterium]|nr:hypothetical protein [Candidatus Vicinibacter affinis]
MISAQGCDKIVFNVQNTGTCCYKLIAQNGTEFFTCKWFPFILYTSTWMAGGASPSK